MHFERIVIPFSFSNWFESIDFYEVSPEVFIRVSTSVVFPWSTWPIVPTLTCGLVRVNFSLPMFQFSKERIPVVWFYVCTVLLVRPAREQGGTPSQTTSKTYLARDAMMASDTLRGASE